MLGRTLQGHLGLAALPGVDRLDYGTRAHGKAVSLPASPNFLPVSKLGKTLDEAGCIRKSSMQRAGRVCFQEPLAGFLKGV